MFQIDNLKSTANQTSTATLADGSTVTLTFKYRPTIQRWTVDVLYKNFIANGVGLSTHPNLLRIWRDVIPFGLQVVTVDGTDPFMASDLDTSGGQTPRVIVNILDGTAGQTDLTDVEAASFS